MAQVSVRKVVKAYETYQAVHGIDLDIADEEFVVLVGPSGCGKSTTLRMIAGLEEITAGEIWIGGDLVNDVPPRDRDIAMVFQNYALYPHMTVYDNMAFGLKLRKFPKDQIKQRVGDAARILDITPLLARRPKALSGGQRQRVAMGRAIVRNPRVFLFDEPLSNLDAKLRVQMRTEIKKVHQTIPTTTVYVTHDQIEAMTLADRVVVMNAGRIEQVGPPQELYHHPATRFVAGFIGSPSMNFLPVHVFDESGLKVKLASGEVLRDPAAAVQPLCRLQGPRHDARHASRAHHRAARPGEVRRRAAELPGRRGRADGHGDDGAFLRRRPAGNGAHRPLGPCVTEGEPAARRRHEPDAPDRPGLRPRRVTGLDGQVAWVTGAGSGIGRAVALALAGAGCRVGLTGRSLEPLRQTEAMIRDVGGLALAAAADVADEARLAGAHRAVLATWGPVDVLVNNAGWNVARRHWRQLDAASAQLLLGINLAGPVLANLLVLPAMRERRAGTLVHIGSITATAIYTLAGPLYTVTKQALRAMSLTLNAEEGINGIRSVCIHPGEVDTPILDRRPSPPSAEDRAKLLRPEDVAEAVLFCLRLPPQACVSELTLVPTDNGFQRADAHAAAARA